MMKECYTVSLILVNANSYLIVSILGYNLLDVIVFELQNNLKPMREQLRLYVRNYISIHFSYKLVNIKYNSCQHDLKILFFFLLNYLLL